MKPLARLLYFVAVYTALFIAQKLHATESSQDVSLAPYLLVTSAPGDTPGDTIPLKNTKVDVSIDGVVAHVTIEQTYANTGNQPIHAEYVFPGSTRSAVHGMTMQTGESIVRAVIREKGAAKKEFEQAKSENKSASLLEQKRPNVFQTSLANILPGDEMKITLEYSESVVPEEGTYQWVFPTVVGPRFTHGEVEQENKAEENWSANPHLEQAKPSPASFSLKARLHSGLDLAEVKCPTHPIEIKWNSAHEATVELNSAATHANRDLIMEWKLAKNKIDSGILINKGEKETTFLLQIEPPARVSADVITSREYIFVVDVSGSMTGFPLNTAYQLMEKLLGSIHESDTFNLILFAGSDRVYQEASLPASASNIASAINWMKSSPTGGNTEMLGALQSAMRLPNDESRSRSVILITDGFINFEAEAFELIRNNLHQNNVFCFGIGSSVNRHLIEGIAHCGQGEPFVVTTPSEADAAVKKLTTYVSSPVLSHITLTAEGTEVYEIEPSSIRDLFANRPIAVIGKIRQPLQGSVVLRGTQANGVIYEKKIDLATISESQRNNPALPILWARERVRSLGDYNNFAENSRTKNTEKNANITEITRIGLEYSLLTPYTSFIAINDTPREITSTPKTVRQVLPLPAGVNANAISGGNTNSIVASNSSVPEPGSTSLLLLIAIIFAVQRRR